MGEKKWYVVNTYSGYEDKAKTNLHLRAKQLHMEEKLGRIEIPKEPVVEMRGGKRHNSMRKFFPGYILVEMDLDNEVWHLVKNTPKITGFIGSATSPPSIPQHEVDRILDQMKESEKEPTMILAFGAGDAIKVIDGPFSNFSGRVEHVDEEKKRLKVLVQIFGRDTPVDLEFSQVEKTS